MKLEDAIKKIVEDARKGNLDEGQTSDPAVDDTASAIVHALITAIDEEGDAITGNAFEVMMGSAPDENRLTKVRLEDIPATAQLVVQAVYRDASLHAKLTEMAHDILQSASEAIQHDWRGEEGVHEGVACEACGMTECECAMEADAPVAESKSVLSAIISDIVAEMKLGVAGRSPFHFGGGSEVADDDVAHFLITKKKDAPEAPKSGVKTKKSKQKSKKPA